jgi:hypothetical protein
MVTTQRRLPFGPEKLVPFTEELFEREEERAAALQMPETGGIPLSRLPEAARR